MYPAFQLSYIDYIFIESDQDVRAWLLANPVLEDLLDLMVYCHRPATRERAATLPLRGHHYLPENDIANWARQAGACTGIQAPQREVRPDHGPANAAGNQGNDSPLFLPVPSSSSCDFSDAGEGCEAIIGTSPSAVADPAKSLHSRILLAIHTPSKMNTNAGLELRGRAGHTPEVKARKRGAPSNSEDLEHLNKRLRHTSNFRELLNAKDDRKRVAQFHDEKGDEHASFVKRMRRSMSAEFGRSDGDSLAP